MKVNELRIGNIVKSERENIYKLSGIVGGNFGLDIVDINSGELMCISARFALPVHLTEEWLLKFGFQKKQTDRYGSIFLVVDNMKFIYSEGIFMFGVEGVAQYHYTRTKIEYVHQLQNLYFALTGKELEAKL